jgi:dynein heavy chain 1
MTLGTIWDMDLKKNEGIIREVLAQAAGEVALEEYIKQVGSNKINMNEKTINNFFLLFLSPG